jgi:ferredoxin
MLREVVPDLAERHAYMCGPEEFMEAAKGYFAELAFDPSRLHMESFGGARSQAGSPESADALKGTTRVEFARSGQVLLAAEGANLLELAEANGIEVDYSCRAGSCGDCKVRLLHGQASEEFKDGLTDTEQEQGFILACASAVAGDSVLDA